MKQGKDITTLEFRHKDNLSSEELNKLRETIRELSSDKLEEDESNNIEELLTQDEHRDHIIPTREILDKEIALQLTSLTQSIKKWEKTINNSLLNKTRSTAKPSYHLEAMSLFFSLEKELANKDNEIEIHLSEETHQYESDKILPLFELIDEEISESHKKKRVKLKEIGSHTKTLDRTKLEGALNEYKKALEDSGQADPFAKKIVLPTLVSPNPLLCLIGFIIDIFTVLLFTVGFLFFTDSSFQILVKEDLITNIQHFSIEQIYLISQKFISSSLLQAFLIAWFPITIISSIIFQATPGQNLVGIIICKKDGSSPSTKQLALRQTAQLLTISTLGIRNIVRSFKSNGFYCTLSKTRITYRSCLNEIDNNEFFCVTN